MGSIALLGTGVFWFLGEAHQNSSLDNIIPESDKKSSFSDDIKSVVELL